MCAHMEEELLRRIAANRLFVAKKHSGIHIALGDNVYGTMIVNPRNDHDHLKDVAEADDLLKQHEGDICRIEIIIIIVQQQMLAIAWQEIRKTRYISMLAAEVTSRKTRRKGIARRLASSENRCVKMTRRRRIIYVSSVYFIVTFTLEEYYGVNFEYQC